jgi:hypothetical protein
MKAEAEAVTVGDGNTGGSGSGGSKDNGGNSNGGCTDKNNQQSTKSVGGHVNKDVNGDSNNNEGVKVGGGGGGPCRLQKSGGRGEDTEKRPNQVGAVVAAVVLAAVAVAVVLTAAAVVSTVAADNQCQPLVGLLVGLGGEDASLLTHSMFWRHLAIIWRPF